MAHLWCSVSVSLKASRLSVSNACLSVALLCTTFTQPTQAQDGFTDLGLPSYGTFHGTNFDSVLLQTGNLHLHVPILSFPGRGITLDTNYLYDTQQWTATFTAHPTQQYPHGGFYNVLANNDGSGWRLAHPFDWRVLYTPSQGNCTYTDPNTGQQFQYPYNVFTNFRVVDPEGTSHPVGLRMITPVLCNNGGTSEAGPSTDGSGIWLQVPPGNGGVILTNWTITLKDGTRADTSEDANGNLSGGFGGSALQIVDAPGTTYTSPLGQTQPGPAYTTWTVQDSNGVSQVYRLDYTFATSEVKSADVKLDQTITLPSWAEQGKASPEEQKAFSNAVSGLKEHEEGHVEINRQQAEKLDKSLPGTTGTGQAKTPQEALNKATKNMVHKESNKAQQNNAQTRTLQQAYDKKTDHGRKQHEQQ